MNGQFCFAKLTNLKIKAPALQVLFLVSYIYGGYIPLINKRITPIIKVFKGVIQMKENTCESCKYFVQHYVKHTKTYSKAGWGALLSPENKGSSTTNPACERYKERAKP